MENSQQVTQYLEEVAQVLIDLHVQVPFHMLIAGGAYMLLHKKRKFTEDIDFALVEQPQRLPKKKNQVFQVTLAATEVFRSRSTIPFSAELEHI